jgi:mannose-6-phosphate isomerase-like protein (cupin superfamily)
MDFSRRDLSALLPSLLFAAKAEAASGTLPSKTFPFGDLPMKTNGENQTRAVLDGRSQSGCPLEIHVTNLPPGGMPHPAHRHVHDEMILVQEGTMEVTIEGKKSKLGPGSVAYVHSNEEHGWQNVGSTRAQYFVIAIGRQNA